jgi:tetratricopeptide (TPR) repeat protein
MLKLAQVWDKRGNQDEIERWLHQARKQLGDESSLFPALYAEIYSELGWLNLRRGKLEDAEQWLEQGLELVKETEHYGVLSSILNRLGALHYHRGEWEQAASRVEGALELREKLGDLVGYARSLNNLGILQRASGDWDGALSSYERARWLGPTLVCCTRIAASGPRRRRICNTVLPPRSESPTPTNWLRRT